MYDAIEKILCNLNAEQTDALLKGDIDCTLSKRTERRIMNKYYKRIGEKKKTYKIWLFPVAAALAIIITLSAIPEARAAITDFVKQLFRIEDYMLKEKSERPVVKEIENIIQTPIPSQTKTDGTTVEFSDVSEKAEFIKNLDIHIDETMYDGEKLIISGTIKRGADKLNPDEDPKGPDCILSPESQTTLTDANGNTTNIRSTANLIPSYVYNKSTGNETNHDAGDCIKFLIDSDMNLQKAKSTNDKAVLKGIQDTAIRLTFMEKDGPCIKGSQMYKPVGYCTIKYQFDATAGASQIKTVKPGKNIPLSGSAKITELDIVKTKDSKQYLLVKNIDRSLDDCEVKVDTVSVKPTGITIRLLYRCPQNWPELQRKGFIGGIGYGLFFRAVVNGENIGNCEEKGGKYDDTWRYSEQKIPYVGDKQKEIKKIEIEPVMGYITKINGEKITLEEKKIPIEGTSEDSGWKQDDDEIVLKDFTFTVDLP